MSAFDYIVIGVLAFGVLGMIVFGEIINHQHRR